MTLYLNHQMIRRDLYLWSIDKASIPISGESITVAEKQQTDAHLLFVTESDVFPSLAEDKELQNGASHCFFGYTGHTILFWSYFYFPTTILSNPWQAKDKFELIWIDPKGHAAYNPQFLSLFVVAV